MNIRRALKELGFDTVDSKFYSLIDVWKSWYDGDVKDFHSYTVWNGIEELECHRYSVNMGKKVCEDWANLLMNERVNTAERVTGNGEAVPQESVSEICRRRKKPHLKRCGFFVCAR